MTLLIKYPHNVTQVNDSLFAKYIAIHLSRFSKNEVSYNEH